MTLPHHDIQKECFDFPSPKLEQLKCADHFQIKLTSRLRHAGPMVSDCQQRRDPGVACSRLVGRFVNAAWISVHTGHQCGRCQTAA